MDTQWTEAVERAFPHGERQKHPYKDKEGIYDCQSHENSPEVESSSQNEKNGEYQAEQGRAEMVVHCHEHREDYSDYDLDTGIEVMNPRGAQGKFF